MKQSDRDALGDGLQNVESSSNGRERGIPRNCLRSGVYACSTGDGIAGVCDATDLLASTNRNSSPLLRP